ncbi:MAG: hypothetical protein JW705_00025 [Methanosarcinaceae archaeon]|nr:hypothetical protein [Methanosarcinaceae archaeon]
MGTGIADLANEEKDYATQIFLQWFLTGQIKGESNDNKIILKLKMFGNEGNDLSCLTETWQQWLLPDLQHKNEIQERIRYEFRRNTSGKGRRGKREACS